jgi:nicotinate-nucleotide adenylyltransferase
MRIGVYGGSFDPPHRGHLAVAIAAAESFALDVVYITPTGIQPLKNGASHASFEDRLAMVRLLCEGRARLAASKLDRPNVDGSPNYTVDLLRQHEHASYTLFSIVGADSFLDLRRWREPEELLRLADWIVASRPGFSLKDLAPLALTSIQRERVHLLESLHIEISATEIRERLARGEDCSNVLTPEVAEYIRAHHLYSNLA